MDKRPDPVPVIVVPLAEPARSAAIAQAARLTRVILVWERPACRAR